MELVGRHFQSMVRNWWLQDVVSMITDQANGRLLHPEEIDKKTGMPVIDVLWEMHPEPVIPTEEDFDCYDYDPDVKPHPSWLGSSAMRMW